MKMFGAPFLSKPLRSPMDFRCHSCHTLPHLGSCSIFLPSLFLTLLYFSKYPEKHTLSHSSVWLKFRMLPFFKVSVCLCMNEACLEVSKCMPQACMWRSETIFPAMLLSVYLVEEGSLLFLLLSSIFKADSPVFVSYLT